MHRTGMILGVLQKVVNEEPMAAVEASYRYHVGFENEEHPGGFETNNLDFIRYFKREYVFPAAGEAPASPPFARP